MKLQTILTSLGVLLPCKDYGNEDSSAGNAIFTARRTFAPVFLPSHFYCIDGSLFPVINSMLWANYTSKHQSLKLHLCFELNRMIAAEFLVSAANYSERKALLKMVKYSITYIADRGYMSFQICHEMLENQAYFIFRNKNNLLYKVSKTLPVQLPQNALFSIDNVTDELIQYTNDKFKHIYRLVTFSISRETFYVLTNREDLTTFQIIMLYGYRWQIELM